ncbi:MAG: PRC-barrel domain-containing protein [Thermoplasmata archaeon]
MGNPMLVEATEFLGRQTYTTEGHLLGDIDNLVVDVDAAKVDGLYFEEINPVLVSDPRPVSVPFRWVSAVNDIVILKYFPKRVSVKRPAGKSAEPEAPAA